MGLVIVAILMTRVGIGQAQEGTPPAVGPSEEPCAAVGQGAAPGMMTPGAIGPGMPAMPTMTELLPMMGTMGMGPSRVVAALCAAAPVDSAVVAAMILSDQMTQFMPRMMQQWVTRPELRQVAQDIAATRQQELEQLLRLRQALPATGASAGTPTAASGADAASAPQQASDAVVTAYDISFEPTALTIPAPATATRS